MDVVSNTYGYFSLSYFLVILNNKVLGLVQKNIELMPFHHEAILTSFHVDKKVKDKRYQYLVTPYEIVSF